jgi:1-acyl-sn-glycerol-3-phosphate acyltransferase
MLRTIVAAGFLALYLLLVGPIFILHCLLTRSPERLYRAGVFAVRLALRICGVRISVEGEEHIPPGVCIFVGNHTSNIDPPVAVLAIRRRVALLGKKEVFRIPILSRAMRLAGFVPVDRGNREAATESIEEAIGRLRHGLPFLIFPEGTRSPDGRLREFRRGAFLMAIRAGVPVVPFSIIGAHRIMRKGEPAIHPGTVVVRFHPPVESSGYRLDAMGQFIARVHGLVADGLPEEQRPARGTADKHS